MTWDEIGRDCLAAARKLLAEQHFRSCVSRAYYAAFSVVVGRVIRAVRIPPRMMTPRHDTLPAAVRKHLTRLYPKVQRTISKLLVQLYRERIRADYNAKVDVDERDALEAVRMAAAIFKLLEVP